MRPYSSGEQNLQKKWMAINSKKIMLTTLDICTVRRVRETTIKHGVAQRFYSYRSLDRESTTDALLRILEKIKSDN